MNSHSYSSYISKTIGDSCNEAFLVQCQSFPSRRTIFTTLMLSHCGSSKKKRNFNVNIRIFRARTAHLVWSSTRIMYSFAASKLTYSISLFLDKILICALRKTWQWCSSSWSYVVQRFEFLFSLMIKYLRPVLHIYYNINNNKNYCKINLLVIFEKTCQ